MSAPTRVSLFVPGPAATAWRDVPTPPEVALEWVPHDGGFGAAFALGTVGADTVEAVDRCEGAVVAHLSVDLRDGRATAVALVERLRAVGGLAVRLEESGLGWEVGRWLAAFGTDDPWTWHRHAVVTVRGHDAAQSCGMHAFSLPDVRVAADDPDGPRVAEALNRYQLDEDPLLRSGETFAPDADTPRRRLERWPDTQHAADHPSHNPYGVWRVGPPGSPARPLGESELVFIPALRLLLGATEQQQGSPLDEPGVLAVRDAATCLAMEPAHARALERSRGQADLDPELVWTQWRAVRGSSPIA